ncbi:MAG: diheme cytochrome c, partial [Pseudomonadota bacterium]
YFIKEHKKITQEKLASKGLKSFANCNACHKDANAGHYDD